MQFEKGYGNIILARYLGVAQMVARYLGVVEAVGSSPVTQTRKKDMRMHVLFSFSKEKSREEPTASIVIPSGFAQRAGARGHPPAALRHAVPQGYGFKSRHSDQEKGHAKACPFFFFKF